MSTAWLAPVGVSKSDHRWDFGSVSSRERRFDLTGAPGRAPDGHAQAHRPSGDYAAACQAAPISATWR